MGSVEISTTSLGYKDEVRVSGTLSPSSILGGRTILKCPVIRLNQGEPPSYLAFLTVLLSDRSEFF